MLLVAQITPMLKRSVLANNVHQYQHPDISLKLCNGAGTLGLDSKTSEAGSWQVSRRSRRVNLMAIPLHPERGDYRLYRRPEPADGPGDVLAAGELAGHTAEHLGARKAVHVRGGYFRQRCL